MPFAPGWTGKPRARGGRAASAADRDGRWWRMARTKLVMALALTSALVGAGSAAWPDAPPGPYFNGFETNTAVWFNLSGATISRVPSGSSSPYANGVSAATDSYYARLGKD